MNEPISSEPDFDAFLAAASNAESLKAESEVRHFLIEQKLQESLNELQVPRVFDYDEKMRLQLEDDFLKDCRHYIFENEVTDEIVAAFDGDMESLSEAVEIESRMRLSERAAIERKTLAIIGLLIIASETDGSSEAASSRTDGAKKRLMADLLIREGMATSDPWYQFVNVVTPGEGLMPDSEKDATYMNDTLEKLADEKRRQEVIEQFINNAVTTANEYGVSGLQSGIIQSITVAVWSTYIANNHRGEIELRAAWEEKLHELSRDSGLDKSIISSMINYYHQALPKLKAQLEQ